MTIRPAGIPSLGEFDERVVFIPHDKDGRRLPESEIHITGEFVPDVICVPRELRFGRAKPGTVVEDTISWKSLANRPFTIRSVTSDSPSLVVGPVEAGQAGPICRITRHVGVGEQKASLRVEVVEIDGMATNHIVPVTVVGIAD